MGKAHYLATSFAITHFSFHSRILYQDAPCLRRGASVHYYTIIVLGLPDSPETSMT